MERRDYLKLAGTAATGTVLASGSAAASHTVIDVVEDLGVDNTGGTAVDDAIQPHVADNTRLEFPDGRYLLDQLVTYDVENFTMVGTGDATLVPGDYASREGSWLGGSYVRDLTFEHFTLDTAGESPTVAFGAYDGLVVRDIEKVGDHAGTGTAFGFSIWELDGYGLVENLRATDGDIYHDSVGATGIYSQGDGTITYRDCALAGWGDNGLYGSDATGTIWVTGGTYANNNVAQIRLSSPGSTVRGAHVRVDEPRGPGSNMRGIRVSDGPGPVDVVDCDIVMQHGQGSGGVVTAFTGGTTNVRDTRIHVGPDYTTVGSDGSRTSFGILADDPSAVDDYAGVYVSNTSITGGGSYGSAILSRRGNTVVRHSCIDQTGTGRDGVIFQTDLGGNVIEDDTIDVPGQTVVPDAADVTVDGIDTSGSCPRPAGLGSSSTARSALQLGHFPLPMGSQDRERPIVGTDPSNPTAILYGRYTEPPMASFAGANLQRIVDDFVRSGRLNLEYRNVPVSPATRYLSELGVGVWDLEPENYWGFVEHVLANQDTIQYDTMAEARNLLENAGVRNYGWIPWRVESGTYDGTVGEDHRAAAEWNMTASSDFPPIIYFDGEVAAPQYSYEGGIAAWLEERV